MTLDLVALVPMRHSSERVPGKNYRRFAGRPLYHHVLLSLRECPSVRQIVVDTDSPVISGGISADFPEVVVIERPTHLRDGMTPMNEVLLHDIRQVEAELYLQTHCTNPLLKASTIERAVSEFTEEREKHDSLVSVTKLQKRLWDQSAAPINHDPAQLVRTQDLPTIYEENSSLYIFPRTTLLSKKTRIGQRPLLFEMDPVEAWDIDQESDFAIAECLFGR